jgi:Domain of unknown function (DUF4129)
MALPALVVLALVAVVAIASTGSTPSGSGTSRPPSETLLDTLFSLGIVAVVAGGLLLVYGLSQRKAIAREVASGRYRRTSLAAWLAFVALFSALSYWRLTQWTPRAQESVAEEPTFGGEIPVAIAPDQRPSVVYEPSVSWIPIAAVVGLVLVAAIAYVVGERRARDGREAQDELVEELAGVFDETLDDLRAELDPRRAIVAAYARLERVLAAYGIARRPAETSHEYLTRVLRDLAVGSEAIASLTHLFTQAKFSHHDIDNEMKGDAIDALQRVRDELRLAQEHRPNTEIDATVARASS